MANQPRAAVDAAVAYIESNLDSGQVVKETFNGSSSWSSAYTYETSSGKKYFVKMALGRGESMFRGEAQGLQAMYDTHTLRIPKVYHVGSLSKGPPGGGSMRGSGSYIVMEYLNLSGRSSQADLGRQLALMHCAEPSVPEARAGKFGFPVDNTIGGTAQPNGWMDNWVDFFRERRLRHMLQLAGEPSLKRMGHKLCDKLEVFFEGIQVKPSVLHGDLWSGNIAAVDGQPCIFDPATYYGHHEAEFGMSWCAGFTHQFYNAYHEIIPKDPGFEDRKQIYLLYHYLNHYVLFGSGYYSECESILVRLTKKL